jgi:hypothetical protein
MNDFENELKKQPLRPVPEHWRAQILRAASEDTLKREHQQPWWMMLLWPSPKAWGALAVAWVVMACFHIAIRGERESPERQGTAQMQMAIQEKRQLQAEIEEAAVRIEAPKPRSEAMHWGKSA